MSHPPAKGGRSHLGWVLAAAAAELLWRAAALRWPSSFIVLPEELRLIASTALSLLGDVLPGNPETWNPALGIVPICLAVALATHTCKAPTTAA